MPAQRFTQRRPSRRTATDDPRWDWFFQRPLLFSIPFGTAFRNLVDGTSASACTSTSPAAAMTVEGPVGPACRIGTRTGGGDTGLKAQTLANYQSFTTCVVVVLPTGTLGIYAMFNNGSSNGRGVASPYFLTSLGVRFWGGTGIVAVLPGSALTAGQPHVIVTSITGDGSSAFTAITQVARNLVTGAIVVGTVTGSWTYAVPNGADDWFLMSAGSVQPLNGGAGHLFAATAIAAGQKQCIQWALDPFGPFTVDATADEWMFGIAAAGAAPLPRAGGVQYFGPSVIGSRTVLVGQGAALQGGVF